MKPTAHSLREDMAEAMLAMRDLCESDGLTWQAEVVTLIGAWGEARRAMGRHDTLKIDLPEPDPGERSPAHELLVRARNTPTGRLADGGGPATAAQPPPPTLPKPTADGPGHMLTPRPRPRLDLVCVGPRQCALWDYLADGGPPLRFPNPSGSRAVSVRCSEINRSCTTHRLSCRFEADHVTITRVLRQ